MLPKHRIIMASWFRAPELYVWVAVNTERICGCPLIVNDQPITEYISSQNSSAPHRHLESIVHISTATTSDLVYLLRAGINDVAPPIKCTPVQTTDWLTYLSTFNTHTHRRIIISQLIINALSSRQDEMNDFIWHFEI